MSVNDPLINAWEATIAATVATLQHWFEPAQQARAQALYVMVGYGLGGALGTLAASWVWTAVAPSAAFLVSAVAAALGAWVFCRCREPQAVEVGG
mgnify:CR=1 FL=1